MANNAVLKMYAIDPQDPNKKNCQNQRCIGMYFFCHYKKLRSLTNHKISNKVLDKG